MPIIRVTRQGSIGQCDCKVGGCRICGSSCRRCKCSCDGVSPLDALKRKAGGQRRKRSTKSTGTNDEGRNKCHILLPNSSKMTECVTAPKRRRTSKVNMNHATVNKRDKHNNNVMNIINNCRRTRSTKIAKTSTNEREETTTTTNNNNDTQDKYDTNNDIRTQTNEVNTTNNHDDDDDTSFATAKDVMNRIDSQSSMCSSYKTTHSSTNESRITFGRKVISHMKQVMRDTIIDNDDRVSLDTNTDDNSTKNNKVKQSTSTNINEEKENNSTSTKQSEKITQI